jgi:hypothetical protein
MLATYLKALLSPKPKQQLTRDEVHVLVQPFVSQWPPSRTACAPPPHTGHSPRLRFTPRGFVNHVALRLQRFISSCAARRPDTDTRVYFSNGTHMDITRGAGSSAQVADSMGRRDEIRPVEGPQAHRLLPTSPGLSRKSAPTHPPASAPPRAPTLGIPHIAASATQGDMKTAHSFSRPVAIYSSPSANVTKSAHVDALPEPGSDAMALAYKFSGMDHIHFISSHKSPHLLEYHPRSIINLCHSSKLNDVDRPQSTFLLNTTEDEVKQNAGEFPKNADVIVSNNAMRSVIHQVALLGRMRPDLRIYGHASFTRDDKNQKGAIEAFRRVGALLEGEKSVVVHVLNEQDRHWIARETGVEMPPGAAIQAGFDRHGKLDRKSFLAELNSRRPDPAEVVTALLGAGSAAVLRASNEEDRQAIGQAGASGTAGRVISHKGTSNRDDFIANLQSFRQMNAMLDLSAVTPLQAGAPATGRIRDALRRALPNRKDPLKALGTVLLLGSTGNVGDGILRALSGRVRIDAPVRDTARVKDASYLGNMKYPVRQLPLATYGAQGNPGADTVFIAASAPRDKSRTDRAGQLIPNIDGVMIPLLPKIPASARLVQVITNPCADMAFAVWLLRPDLAGKIASHSGTDIVRQQEHVAKPHDANSFFTFGPHSPKQLNVDLAAKRIDPSIATKANDINKRSGGQATTDPTSLSSIYEAMNILTGKQSSYAFPLTREEASRLQRFLRESGTPSLRDIEVHEGTAPTLPRKHREIHWDLLEKGRRVPGFLDHVALAIEELNLGRLTVLQHIASEVARRQPKSADGAQVDLEWALRHRDGLLSLLNAPGHAASSSQVARSMENATV